MSDPSWNWDIDEFEDEYPMAARQQRIDNFDPVARTPDAKLFRRIMDAVGFWRHCRRPDCRRARRCVAPKVDCAWRKLPYLQRYIFPEILKLKAERLAQIEAEEAPDREPPGPPA